MAMTDNERVIEKSCAAWSRLDARELASLFVEDGVYHNMPAGPVAGRANVEKFIQGFSGSWNRNTWDILNIASAGNRVFGAPTL